MPPQNQTPFTPSFATSPEPTSSSSFSSDYQVSGQTNPSVLLTPPISTPTPVLEVPLRLSNEKKDNNIDLRAESLSQKKRGLSYLLLGIVLLFAGVVLAGQQYGLGDILPYPLSGLIAAGLVVLIALWMIARGWLGKMLSIILGIVSVGIIAYMLTDVLAPGIVPASGEWGFSFSYQKEQNGLSLYLLSNPNSTISQDHSLFSSRTGTIQ